MIIWVTNWGTTASLIQPHAVSLSVVDPARTAHPALSSHTQPGTGSA
jgi:hypothetical protein